MFAFVVAAVALAAISLVVIAVPLLKSVPSQNPKAAWTAVAAASVLFFGSVALYATWSNWSWPQSPGVDSPEGMVERLVHRLSNHPDDVADWLMLGRAYVVLQEYPLAVRAYERADRAARGRSVYALLGEANALMLTDDPALGGEADQLFERALAIDPSSPQALFFGAAAALRRDQLPLARARFAGLLALNPSAKIKAILEQEISGIDRTLALRSATPTQGPPNRSPGEP